MDQHGEKFHTFEPAELATITRGCLLSIRLGWGWRERVELEAAGVSLLFGGTEFTEASKAPKLYAIIKLKPSHDVHLLRTMNPTRAAHG